MRVFETMTVFSDMFRTKVDLLQGIATDSEVVRAVRNATPESRREFEEKFGPISLAEYVIASPASGGWVDRYELTEDGRVLRVRYEGISAEANLVREGVQAGTTSEIPEKLARPPVAGRWVDEPDEDLSE